MTGDANPCQIHFAQAGCPLPGLLITYLQGSGAGVGYITYPTASVHLENPIITRSAPTPPCPVPGPFKPLLRAKEVTAPSPGLDGPGGWRDVVRGQEP